MKKITVNLFKWLFTFNPESSLLTLPILYIAVLPFILFALYVAFIIYNNTDFPFVDGLSGLDSVDIGYLVSMFKVPLAITALAITAVGLIASNHRSVQTKEQIKVTNAQNIFANYYKHKEEFNKYLKDHLSDENIHALNPDHIHGSLFDKVMDGNYGVDETVTDYLYSKCDEIRELLAQFDTNKEIEISEVIFHIEKILRLLERTFGITWKHFASRVDVSIDDKRYGLPDMPLKAYLRDVLSLRLFNLEIILNFDSKHIINPSLTVLTYLTSRYNRPVSIPDSLRLTDVKPSNRSFMLFDSGDDT